jgi:protoheme ferro-lyase
MPRKAVSYRCEPVTWCTSDENLKRAVCVRNRYFREGYLRAMAELIEKELQKFDSPEKTEIFFSAHGVPVSYVEQVWGRFLFLSRRLSL